MFHLYRISQTLRLLKFRSLHCLTFNTGSSTLKYSLYDVQHGGHELEGTLISTGIADRVGKDDVRLTVGGGSVNVEPRANHEDCLKAIAEALPSGVKISTVGHRVVHGGVSW